MPLANTVSVISFLLFFFFFFSFLEVIAWFFRMKYAESGIQAPTTGEAITGALRRLQSGGVAPVPLVTVD